MDNFENYQGDRDIVRKQLLKILSSPEFRNSQVLSRFLQFVVEEVLADRPNEIKEYSIGVRALGRAPDFNPQTDAVVRIHAGRLRRILHEYYHSTGLNDPVLIDIPKGNYVPVFKLVNIETPLGTKINDATALSEETPSPRKATLAVFPFHNLSADDSKEYFVRGIGEQLCTDLARFQHLSVISYYSTYKVAGEKASREIHDLFDIDYIVNGSTRFFDGMIQVNTQLMLGETDTLLWSQSFLREFNPDNILGLQEDIIQQIVYKIADNDGIITTNIAHNSKTKKKNIFGVYEAIYLYFSFKGKYDAESFEKSKLALENALAVEPNNALMWALLSKLFLNSYIFKINSDPEDFQKARAHAEKALWLDQNCQYAYKALAWVHLLDGKIDDCEEAIRRCLDLNPKSPSITGNMGFLMVCIGKYTQGFHLLLKAMSLNSIFPWYCNLGMALYYYYAAKYEDAFEWAQKAQPSNMPFVQLVNSIITEKVRKLQMDRKNGKPHQVPSQIRNHASSILSLFIHDIKLRKQMTDELKSAGVIAE
jgi:TolB-like protein/Tfp pilus assembly protein PilF